MGIYVAFIRLKAKALEFPASQVRPDMGLDEKVNDFFTPTSSETALDYFSRIRMHSGTKHGDDDVND